jgi:hypothetical protein
MPPGVTRTRSPIRMRYDDGTIATIQQKGAPNLRIGDRVLVTPGGIELLR